MVHVKQEVIRFADTDAAGILYFGSFTTYFDESFLSMLREQGIGWDEHQKHQFLLPIIEQKTNYFSPLKFGDEVRIYCTITRLGNKSFTSHHVIEKKQNEDIVAIGYITRVCVDYQQFTSIIIPKILRECLQKHNFETNKLRLPYQVYEKLSDYIH